MKRSSLENQKQRRLVALQLLAAQINCSDNQTTKVACVIDCEDSFISSANQLALGITPTEERLTGKNKHKFIMHAEQRAIATAARIGEGLFGCTMYVTWFPCSACAASIIQAGISRIVCDRAAYEKRISDPTYAFSEAMEMLVEAKVEVCWVEQEITGGQL